MSLPKERARVIWFLLPFLGLLGVFIAMRNFSGPAPGSVVDRGKGYEGVVQEQSIIYDFSAGYQEVDLALNQLFAGSGFIPSEISRLEREASYSQPLPDDNTGSWFRPALPKKVTWPAKELTVLAPYTDSGLLVFDYQRMLEAKLWAGGARVISEELIEVDPGEFRWDKLSQLMADTGSKKVVGLHLEIGFSASPGGHDVTVVTHQVTLLQPWVESYAQRFPGKVKPKMAIVLDDWGYHHPEAVEVMFSLPKKLNMAVIPGLSDSNDQALEGFSRGWEVMLHLPMEPQSAGWRLGEYAVKTGMSEVEIRETVRKGLAAVPAVSGVNNHMGSKATEDPRVMGVVLDEVRRSGLYFVDSRTTGSSAAPQVAQSIGMPIAENLVFLDNEDDLDYILKRLELLVQVAKRDGQALGIGHLRLGTARALQRFFQSDLSKEVEIVPASSLIQ